MESECIACPFCGEANHLGVDPSAGSQSFTTDCEVCCRPFQVTLECEEGAIVAVSVSGE
jgi:hypothetical protein